MSHLRVRKEFKLTLNETEFETLVTILKELENNPKLMKFEPGSSEHSNINGILGGIRNQAPENYTYWD
jgi:hypothetical protein